MKFSTVSTISGLLALASAGSHTQVVDVVCTDPAPSTVTQTVTITAGGYGGNTGNNIPSYITGVTPPSSTPPYIITHGPTITSVDYQDHTTSVWVYPTGSPSHDCVVAIYEDTIIVTVIIVNVNVTIINGQTTTITSTVHDRQPTFTPAPLPPPKPTTTWGGYPSSNITSHASKPTGTGAFSSKLYPTGGSSSSTSAHGTGSFPIRSSSSSVYSSSTASSYQPHGTGSSSSRSSSSSFHSSSTTSKPFPIGTGGSSSVSSTGSVMFPKPSAYPVPPARRAAMWKA